MRPSRRHVLGAALAAGAGPAYANRLRMARASQSAPGWGAEYALGGASGTKLSSQGWELAFGDDALELNGTGGLRKVSSTASSGLYLEGGAGFQEQRISSVLAISGSTYIGVFASQNNGLNGYFLRRQSATSVRLFRYNHGQASAFGASIAVGTGTKLTLVGRVVGQAVELSILEEGAPVAGGAFTDAGADRLTFGRIAMSYIVTASIASVAGAVTTYATGYLGGSGALASTTMRLGRRTPAGNGAIPASLPSLGLLTSGRVGFWRFDRLSGDPAKWPARVENWQTPAPITALTDADAGSQAVYAISIDGVLKAQTLTIGVQSIAEAMPAYSVANNFDIALRLPAADLGGKIVEFVDGCGDMFTDLAQATFSSFKSHTGTVEIRRPPGSAKSIRALQLRDCQNLVVRGLKIENALPLTGAPGGWDGVSSGWSNNQNRALVTFSILDVAGTLYGCNNVQITECEIGAPLANMADKTTWYTGIAVAGSTSSISAKHTNIVIGAKTTDEMPTARATTMPQGNVLRRVKDGLVGGNIDNMTIRGNLVQDFCSNASFFAGKQLRDIDFWDNTLIDGWKNPADPFDHPDFCQWGSTAAAANYERIKVRRVKMFVLLADKHTQGPFANDIAFNSAATGPVVQPSGQKLTGYECIDCEYSNILYNVGSSISLVMEVGSGWVLKNISLVRGQGANIQEAYVDPFPRGSTQTETVSGIAHPAAGTASHLAVHSLGAIPGMSVTKSVAYDAVKGGGTGLSGPPNQNEAVRTAYYSTFYAQPGAADPFDQFIPKVGGALVQGDGSYAGGLNPDGSWATGAAF